MEQKIQIITNEENSIIPNVIFNKFNSPQSFDDFDINIIDISSPNVWCYNGNMPLTLNIEKDILSIIDMIKISSSKILILLPQNIKYNYQFCNNTKQYQRQIELKNDIHLLNYVICKLLKKTFEYSIVIYNKTSTLIQGIAIDGDFVFSQEAQGAHITLSKNGKSVTTLNYNNIYLTTINISKDNYINLSAYLEEIKWSNSEEECPNWVREENFLDDETLLANNEKLTQKKVDIEQKIKDNEDKFNNNLFYKSILYSTGEHLVNVVNRILDEMIGYDYEKFDDLKEEDFLIEKQDCVLIGEIKGINTNVKRSNITQTLVHRDLYLEIEKNENKNVYAIAIINRERKKKLSERTEIHQDVIKVAEMNNVLLITSEVLLRLYEKFRKQEINSDEILTLFKGKGLLKI